VITRSFPALARALSAPTKPWSNLAVDGAIVAYALWTVTCHAVMLARGDTYALAWAAACVGVVSTLGAAIWCSRNLRPGGTPSVSIAAAAPIEEAPRSVEQLLLGTLAAGVIAIWLWKDDPLLQWRVVLAYLLIAAVLCLRDSPPRFIEDLHGPRLRELALWAMSLGCGLLSLWMHRWRNDDCYYVNLAVTTVDLPHEALLSLHTIHAPIANAVDSNLVFPPLPARCSRLRWRACFGFSIASAGSSCSPPQCVFTWSTQVAIEDLPTRESCACSRASRSC